jgi:hypothetical protein
LSIVALSLFPPTVDSIDHEFVQQYRTLLTEMADSYNCKMTSFAIKQGVVFFSFDSQEVVDDILEDLAELTGQKPVMCDSIESFHNEAKNIL